MRIGVLYESDEWSDYKLTAEFQRAFGSHAQVQMVDMMRADAIECALSCHLLVSRVFASAQFRGHEEALRRMEELICRLEGTSTRLVNPPRAHAFEVDKRASAQALAQANIRVPRTFASGTPASLRGTPFPKEAIIKPVCGGRTTLTTLARTPEEADAFLAAAPDIPFVIQEYLTPSRGFITRIEVIAHAPAFAMKRSVVANGLSAYRLGSTYERYPDCPPELLRTAARAAEALGFFFGSFDVIERDDGAFFIDANSVSNVSEDCTETFGRDLLREYADALASACMNR